MPTRNPNGENDGGKPLVLVVDDDPNVVALARGYLERDGYRVAEAADGLRALELARREQPCLVVLDLMLPGLDGLEVCRRLQLDSMAPVIMLTARVEEADRAGGTGPGGRRLHYQALQPPGAGGQNSRRPAPCRPGERRGRIPRALLRVDQGQPAHPESDGEWRGTRPDTNGVPAADPPAAGTRTGYSPATRSSIGFLAMVSMASTAPSTPTSPVCAESSKPKAREAPGISRPCTAAATGCVMAGAPDMRIGPLRDVVSSLQFRLVAGIRADHRSDPCPEGAFLSALPLKGRFNSSRLIGPWRRPDGSATSSQTTALRTTTRPNLARN